jgi:ergothioneine biosynthesis protein EgtB
MPLIEHQDGADRAIASASGETLLERFHKTRALTEALVQPLSDADSTIQSMEDASPAKWHLAHVTWFWETFLLREHGRNASGGSYPLYDESWSFLFNSYYEAEGARIGRIARGQLSRPSLEEVLAWRGVVTRAMDQLLDDPVHSDLIALGIAHEQQHTELLLTDIKHALFQNPLGPAMWDNAPAPASRAGDMGWYDHPGGMVLTGHDTGHNTGHKTGGAQSGFAFDNEGPRHRVLLEPFALADRLVTNREWEAFIADGGYSAPALWLSDGLGWVREQGIKAPLYWRDDCDFTHSGWQSRDPDAPVTHISYFEADAFATWFARAHGSGARLPTEFEWEAIARGQGETGSPEAHDPAAGNQLDGAAPPCPRGGTELFGDCWQFTRSAYLPYPRFRPAAGAVGEYNGKFMSGQFVLKGASCATVRGHSRSSYRNFFYPHQRWQFTGLRLAKDV